VARPKQVSSLSLRIFSLEDHTFLSVCLKALELEML
jgi:hypothetical protein